MKLWIRSQDKKLLAKINYVFIQELSYKIKNKYEIQSNNGVLGYYNTQERALEVLDEIHQRLTDLQTLEIAHDFRSTRNMDCVYEMPQE